jgi:hypothetical protein
VGTLEDVPSSDRRSDYNRQAPNVVAVVDLFVPQRRDDVPELRLGRRLVETLAPELLVPT